MYVSILNIWKIIEYSKKLRAVEKKLCVQSFLLNLLQKILFFISITLHGLIFQMKVRVPTVQ